MIIRNTTANKVKLLKNCKTPLSTQERVMRSRFKRFKYNISFALRLRFRFYLSVSHLVGAFERNRACSQSQKKYRFYTWIFSVHFCLSWSVLSPIEVVQGFSTFLSVIARLSLVRNVGRGRFFGFDIKEEKKRQNISDGNKSQLNSENRHFIP